MRAVIVYATGAYEQVECSVSASGAVTFRGRQYSGFTQTHSPVTVYELGEWSADVTAATLLSLPPSLCAKLLVAPVLLLRAPLGPLPGGVYAELVQTSQAELGVLLRRQQYKAQLRAAQGSVLEEVARRTKRGGTKVSRPARGKVKCKEASEESEQNDVCELEDEDEEDAEDVLDVDGEDVEGEGDEEDDQDDVDDGEEVGEEEDVVEDEGEDSEVEEDEEGCDDSGGEEEQVGEVKKARRKS